MSCTAFRDFKYFFNSIGKASYIEDKQLHRVSPPYSGIILLYKIDAKGGLDLNVRSVCHSSVSGGFLSSFSSRTISGNSVT